jgi:hypothetical protein
MILRRIFSILLVAAYAVGVQIYNAAMPVYETDAALLQMENSDEAYSFGRFIATWDPTFWGGVFVVAILLCMWVPVIVRRLKETTNA